MTNVWEPSPEVLAACNKVARMSVDEFVAACDRVGLQVQWSSSSTAWVIKDRYNDRDDGYWALHDKRGELVAEA